MTEKKEEERGTDDAPLPSKSARKRTAQAAQQLGEALIELRDAELDALGLPERLADAIREARGIRRRGAGARQRQYIGRLMREIDLEAVRGALAAQHARSVEAAQRFRLLESWRERLIGEPRGGLPGEAAAAFEDLARQHPQIDRSAWQRAIAAARTEREREGASSGASRELFRMLRALLQPPDRVQ